MVELEGQVGTSPWILRKIMNKQNYFLEMFSAELAWFCDQYKDSKKRLFLMSLEEDPKPLRNLSPAGTACRTEGGCVSTWTSQGATVCQEGLENTAPGAPVLDPTVWLK